MISVAPRFARRDLEVCCLGGVEGPPSCRCPGVWDRERREGITAENTEVPEGLRMIPAAPRLARRDHGLCLGGWRGPHPAGARQSETRSVSRIPSTLCVLRVRCGSTRAGGGGTTMLRPSSSEVCCLGGVEGPPSCRCPGVWDRERREGITAENTEVTEGLRMIPAAPRLARRDHGLCFGGGGGAPILPMPGGMGSGKAGRNHRREHGGPRGSPHDSRGSTSCTPRSRIVFGGVEGPPSCRCPPIRDEERVADTVNPLCPPCPLWFNSGGGRRHHHASPVEFGSLLLGGWRGPHPADARGYGIGKGGKESPQRTRRSQRVSA